MTQIKQNPFTDDVDVYPLIELEKHSYQFFSDGNNEYHIYFKLNYQNDVAQLYSDNKDIEIYEFFFEIVNIKTVRSFDNKITITIIRFLEEFLLKDRNRVIFYITNRDDERNRALYLIYEKWFNLYTRLFNSNLGKVNRIIMLDNCVEAYMSCLYIDYHYEKGYINDCLDVVLSEIYPNYKIIRD